MSKFAEDSVQKAKRIFGYKKMPPKNQDPDYIRSKQHNFWHWISVIGYAAMLSTSILASDGVSPILLLMFFMLFTSIPMLLKNWKFLLVLVAILGCSAAFPPLAPLFVIVFLLFYLRRLLMVLTHWKPVFAGCLLYTSVIFAQVFMIIGTESFKKTATAEELLQVRFLVAVIAVPIGIMCFHFVLRWLYMNHYDTKIALGIMGVFPLLLLALIMPILKLDFGVEVPEVPTEIPPGGLIAEGSILGAQATAGEAAAEQIASASAHASGASGLHASLEGAEIAAAHHSALTAQETAVAASLGNAKTASLPPNASLMDAHATEQVVFSSKAMAASRSASLPPEHELPQQGPSASMDDSVSETVGDLFEEIVEEIVDNSFRKPSESPA
ncbi:MAG: hypothetical protein H6727_04340 [Myxococcales bacterium]|nr:hypothetical protein [Myxococcales bacterium]